MATYKDVLLVSSETLRGFSLLDNNLSTEYITPLVVVSQDITLSQRFGKALIDRCKLEIFNKNLNNTPISSEILTLLNDYIEKIIIWDVASRIQIPIRGKIRNIGITVDSDTNSNPVDFSEIKYNKEYYEGIAVNYMNSMQLYICANPTLYPEYYDGDKMNRKTIDYNCPIYLG